MPIAWRTRPIYVSRSYCEAGSSRVPGSEADMISSVEAVVELVVSRNDVRRDGFEAGESHQSGRAPRGQRKDISERAQERGGFFKESTKGWWRTRSPNDHGPWDTGKNSDDKRVPLSAPGVVCSWPGPGDSLVSGCSAGPVKDRGVQQRRELSRQEHHGLVACRRENR
jgi:hypothetical protein